VRSFSRFLVGLPMASFCGFNAFWRHTHATLVPGVIAAPFYSRVVRQLHLLLISTESTTIWGPVSGFSTSWHWPVFPLSFWALDRLGQSERPRAMILATCLGLAYSTGALYYVAFGPIMLVCSWFILFPSSKATKVWRLIPCFIAGLGWFCNCPTLRALHATHRFPIAPSTPGTFRPPSLMFQDSWPSFSSTMVQRFLLFCRLYFLGVERGRVLTMSARSLSVIGLFIVLCPFLKTLMSPGSTASNSPGFHW